MPRPSSILAGMSAPSPHPFPTRIIQAVGTFVLRPLVLFVFRVRVRRSWRRHEGACVYAANHRSFFDPPFVGMWVRDPLSYFARADLWNNVFFRFLLGMMHGIPVNREHPGMSSMKGAVDRLRHGISVLVFPEGTRTRTGRVGTMRDGPALFARRAGVPVIPVYVHRTELCWPRGAILPRLSGGRIEIRFGSPLIAPAHLAPRLQDAWVTRRLSRWMQVQERDLFRG
ncbi:MAG: 1-acyl-sn-glycerol-3-phosphate acyltransferase [Planctomycetes bacterium]|nr:1-acyl-sn-glycerol-3-phosphate acyltransferase [Planctomycetota bacterium]